LDSLAALEQIWVLYGKIHRATVTAADLDYEGSISIDSHLLELVGFLPNQLVQVYNVSNGNRFETYVMKADPHSGVIQINGAAAHLAGPGDLVIIAGYASMPREKAKTWRPYIVAVDADNRPRAVL
jgi:aspartate 1-decarboxylase